MHLKKFTSNLPSVPARSSSSLHHFASSTNSLKCSRTTLPPPPRPFSLRFFRFATSCDSITFDIFATMLEASIAATMYAEIWNNVGYNAITPADILPVGVRSCSSDNQFYWWIEGSDGVFPPSVKVCASMHGNTNCWSKPNVLRSNDHHTYIYY